MTTEWRRWLCLAWLLLIPISGIAAAPMIAATYNDSLFLHSDGSVWGTGNNAYYYPGATSPIRLLEFPNVVSIATATGTNFALLADGTVQAMGWNGGGLLGNGTNSGEAGDPVPVPGLSNVKAIAASFNHVLAVKQDGTVWSWGGNGSGQLGDGTRNDRFSPGKVSGLSSIVSVACSSTNSLALDANGSVWSWGLNYGGAAGDGTEGVLNTNDPNYYKLIPVKVHDLDQVIAIASGSGTNHALRADGTVWSWGDGYDGKNGDGQPTLHQTLPVQVSGLTQVVAISVTNNHSLALKSDGTVWAWGLNNLGQLGTDAVTYSAVPIQVLGVSNIVTIAAGSYHSVAMRGDGFAFGWGANRSAQLGDGTVTSRSTPLAVLGPGGSGQLNLIQPAPVNPNRLPTASIALSSNAGAALLTITATATNPYDSDGTVVGYQWEASNGQRTSGSTALFTFVAPGVYDINLLVEDNQGGRGFFQEQVTVTPGAVSDLDVAPKVALGYTRGMALSNTGHVSAWGDRFVLGVLDPSVLQALPEANPVPIAIGLTNVTDITSGNFSAYALTPNGAVLSWGTNEHGECGVGAQAQYVQAPMLVPGLPPIRAIAAASHVLALSEQGDVYAWGANWAGQLGLGDTNNRFQPVAVPGLNNVAAVAVSLDFSLALKADGTVWAWGNNTYGQLADGTRTDRYQPVQVLALSGIAKIVAIEGAWFAIAANGSVYGVNVPFGSSMNGSQTVFDSLLRLPALDGFVSFAGRWDYALALKPDGSVWTWGYRSSDLLGIDGTADVPSPTQINGITDAVGVAAGGSVNAVWRRDGTVFTWGTNVIGQLGDGTLVARPIPVLVVNSTFDGPLDLAADVSNNIPPDKIPPFFLATHKTGGLSATTLLADVRGITAAGSLTAGIGVSPLVAGNYNVYVAAAAPYGGALYYFQLDSNNAWSALTWPMADFMRGVELGSQDALVRVNILQNVDLRPYIGTSILVGYGTSPDEMLSNARYRTIFTVTQQQ